ncbi:DUF2723 domain-containing protein [Myxococcota bacterium]|nr:DUF2723 domain-containing protein [Myxococcota bacterium]MBU1431888.1 DUF2723 domain-containing protein [Myxococcota bacterium]MBU1896960.1 DUF2723 domain-containing protein [Myxococcota bacterium]
MGEPIADQATEGKPLKAKLVALGAPRCYTLPMPAPRPWWAALLFGAGALFSLSAAPGLTWLDAGELGAAAWELGVAHPPGAPLFILAHKLVMLLPLGDIALRGNLASGLLGACALAVAYLAVAPWGLRAIARLGGLALVASAPLFALHAVTIEVYTGAGLALALGLLLWLRARHAPQDARYPLLLWLWIGVVMGHHPELRLFAALLALDLLPRGRLRGLLRGAPLALAGALSLLYLPLRAARLPWRAWGDPRDLAALWDHWSGARIRAAYADRMGALDLDALWGFGAQLFEAPLLLVLGLIGFGLLLQRRGGWVIPVAWLIDALYSTLINPMGVVDQQNGLLGALLLGIGAAATLHALMDLFKPGPLRHASAALALLGALTWAFWIPRRGDRGLPLLLDAAADELPPLSLLLVTSDNHAAGWAFRQVVEGSRLDVAVFVRQHLWDASSTAPIFRRRPDLRAAWPKPSEIPPSLPLRWEWAEGTDAALRPKDLSPAFPYFGRPEGTGPSFERALSRLRLQLGAEGLVEPAARRALANLLTDLGLYALRERRQLGRGLSALSEAKALEPESARRWNNLGWALALAGRFEEAIIHCDMALRWAPSHRAARLNRARYALQLSRDPTADLNTLIDANPQDADALALRGITRGNQGDLEGARRDFEAALRINPQQADALGGLWQLRRTGGR